MYKIKDYAEFNGRRYGNPWVAIVNKETGKIDFSRRIGSYTGAYGKGEAGSLYLYDAPAIKMVIAYGQKDNRGENTEINYAQYLDGEFRAIAKTDLIDALQA